MNSSDTYRSLLRDLNYSNEMLMISMACKHYEEMDISFRQLSGEEWALNESIRVHYVESASRMARSMTEILYHIHSLIVKQPYSSMDIQAIDSVLEALKGKASKEYIDNAISMCTNLVKKYRLNEVKHRHQLYMTALSASSAN
jgi:hypothetical protein